MSSLETLAEAKIQATLDRRILAFNSAILAVRQEMNRRGVLNSTMTVQGIYTECITLFDQVRDDVKAEYCIVLDESLFVTEKLVSRLILKAEQHFEKVAVIAKNAVDEAASSLVNKEMHNCFTDRIPFARDRVLTDLSLFIDGHKMVKRNRGIAKLLRFIPKFIGRILGWKARES